MGVDLLQIRDNLIYLLPLSIVKAPPKWIGEASRLFG